MKYILGISGGFRPGNRDGAACLVKDDEIVAAAEEERFARIKHAPGLIPLNAIKYCLKEANIDISLVDLLLYAGISHSDMKDRLKRCLEFNLGFSPPIDLVEHHIAHAASSFFASGFEKSNIITMDLSGDSVSTLLAFGDGNEITKVKEFNRPNSIGAFYNIITQYLGFTRQSDEYKVMGLSSYGKPYSDLSWLIDTTADGYSFNTQSIVNVDGKPFPSVQEPLYSEEFLKQFKSPRKADEKITAYHKDIAASAQKKLEDIVLYLLELLYKETGNKNLCIAGGVGLNCVMNSRLLNSPWVENIFIQPASGDAGLALGACLQIALQAGKKIKRMTHPYYGPHYSNEDIEKILKIVKAPYYYHDDIPGFVAKKLSEGAIVGWFQGRMEYGPRALGSRSILADPRRKDMKDKVNMAIKFRESFRPFAPTILSEYGSEYFENFIDSPFMTLNFKAKKEKSHLIPAVVHVDGTSRVQSINRDTNPRYYAMIHEFYRITSIPLVLNTSFNIRNQPIVCNPQDAISTFFGTGMDYLAIGDFIVEKKR